MNRQQKQQEIADLKDMLHTAKAAFLVEYKGLTVAQMQSLRKSLREQNAHIKVSKARLMKIAAQDLTGAQDFSNQFKGQVGLVFACDEVPAVAKKIVGFAKDNEALTVVSGFFESTVLSKKDIGALATLPPREVLLAQLASVLNAPIASFARVLNAPVGKLAMVLQALAEKKGA